MERQVGHEHQDAQTKGSGNIYADLGFKNAEEHALKAELVRQIGALMKVQELTQTDAAHRLGIEQPDVSKLLRGHFLSTPTLFSAKFNGRNVDNQRKADRWG